MVVQRCECGSDTFSRVDHVSFEASGIGAQWMRVKLVFCDACGKISFYLDDPAAFAKEVGPITRLRAVGAGPYRT